MPNANSMMVGIHGVKGSGKDTVGRMLNFYLPSAELWAFGRKLKRICSTVYDLPLEVFYDESQKEVPQGLNRYVPRALMTGMADMLKTRHGNDFFANVLKTAKPESPFTPFIITDVRHAEEAALIRHFGGTIIHLRGQHAAYKDFNHISEQTLPPRSDEFLIKNDGTKRDLLMNVRDFMTWRWGSDILKAYPHVPDHADNF